MTASDEAIQKTLSALKKLVKQFQRNPTPETIKLLTANSTELAAQFKAYSETKFSHEFYETASELVEEITHMRLNPALQKMLVEKQVLSPLNTLVNSIRTAVYKHEGLQKPTPAKTSSASNPITAAQQRAELAAQHSSEATAAAEKANAEGLAVLKEIQAEQKRSGGLVNESLIQKSIDSTLIMYAKNAAAVLAADEATATMLELKELIDKK